MKKLDLGGNSPSWGHRNTRNGGKSDFLNIYASGIDMNFRIYEGPTQNGPQIKFEVIMSAWTPVEKRETVKAIVSAIAETVANGNPITRGRFLGFIQGPQRQNSTPPQQNLSAAADEIAAAAGK